MARNDRKPNYPVLAHDHPYAVASGRIHALEHENRRLAGENRSLRLLAIHGLIYRLDSLIKEEMGKACPNAGRIQRWSSEVGRLRISYETLKQREPKGG